MKLSKIQEVLSVGNLFSLKLNFNVNGQKGYNPILSFIFSFLFYVIFIIMVVYFSSDWVFQINPQTSYTIKTFDDNYEITLDKIFGRFVFRKKYELNKDATEILNKAGLKPDNFYSIDIDIFEVFKSNTIYKFNMLSIKIAFLVFAFT